MLQSPANLRPASTRAKASHLPRSSVMVVSTLSRRLSMRKRWIVACVIAMLALPAAAQGAAPHWQLYADPAPGATGLDGSVEHPPRIDFTVANGTPYLAEVAFAQDGGLTVYRGVGGRSWRQLGGGPLNDPGHRAGSADFATSGGTVWLAWDEGPGDGTSVVHVARLTDSGVKERRGSPIAGASSPQIAYFGGRLYLAYASADGLRVVRTRANGRWFERVGSFGNTPAFPEELGVYGSRLYLSESESNATTYFVLNRRTTGWVRVDDPPDDLFAVRIGDTVYTLGTSGGEAPGAPVFINVFATRRGVTTELPSPAKPGNNVLGAELAVSNRSLWIMWIEGGPGDMSPPFVPHVARLVRGRG
jgi:hypothetical protein